MATYKDSIHELIKVTSTKLPRDVLEALSKVRSGERNGTPARYAMDIVMENIRLAEEKEQPICQDTGSILFFVEAPLGFDKAKFMDEAMAAVVSATEKGFLRQNSVDPLTGRNTGNNLGPGSPYFHFVPKRTTSDLDKTEVRLMLKGGGSENMGAQYSLPYAPLNAERDLDGVKRCILDAVVAAQGNGCAPGVLGVTIGGDRATAFLHSKEQLLRKLPDRNPNPVLAEMEDEIMSKANRLGIGPMGFGGTNTIFGCKIGLLNRLPACYFLTVSYMCWAVRRQGVILDRGGGIEKWLY